MKTILLVEDDRFFSASCTSVLMSLGYQVVNSCYNENVSEMAVNNQGIDLVMIDIDDGRDTDGLHLAEKVLHHRNLPVLFVGSSFGPGFTGRAPVGSGYLYVLKEPSGLALQSALAMAFELAEARKNLSSEISTLPPILKSQEDGTDELFFQDDHDYLIQIVSVLRAAIWIRDIRTRKVLYINPAFEELSGISRQAFYSDPDVFINAIHPDDREWIKKGEVGRSVEHRIVRPDGSIRWVWGRNFSVRNKAGQIYRTAAIVEDITERKLAEENLKLAFNKTKNQMQEIQELHAILSEQVIRDPLTGLLNKRRLQDILDRELDEANRQGYSVGLMIMDIDNFKMINDTYGHEAGDQVLKRVAQLLTERVRPNDFISRYGGDEFLLIMPNIQVEPARQRTISLCRTIQDMQVEYAGRVIQITVSMGIAVFPIHGQTSQELLIAADGAMYSAKQNGRNCVVLCEKV